MERRGTLDCSWAKWGCKQDRILVKMQVPLLFEPMKCEEVKPMPTEYVNRKGDRYYIFQGKTKTGKPKYFASKRATSEKGVLVERLPEDREIREHPSNATVTVRRRKPSQVLPGERNLVDRLAVELSAYSCVQVIIDGDQIVVYTPDTDPAKSAAVLQQLFGPELSGASDWTAQNTRYSAELRFTLADVDQRTFFSERFCHLGSIDDWIPLDGPASLEPLAKKLLPHLGKDSFYDLI